MGARLATALVLGAVASLALGCQTKREPPSTGGEGAAGSRSEPAPPAERPRRVSRRRTPRCPRDAANCQRAGGRVLYVEAVDPDGDGDAHLVVASRQGITAPGLTIVDVKADLRPARLPRPGDWVGAAGPVFPGSRGQSQIEATRLRVRRASR